MLLDRTALGMSEGTTASTRPICCRARYSLRTMGRRQSRLAQLLSFDFENDTRQCSWAISSSGSGWSGSTSEAGQTVSATVTCAVMQARALGAVKRHLMLSSPQESAVDSDDDPHLLDRSLRHESED